MGNIESKASVTDVTDENVKNSVGKAGFPYKILDIFTVALQ